MFTQKTGLRYRLNESFCRSPNEAEVLILRNGRTVGRAEQLQAVEIDALHLAAVDLQFIIALQLLQKNPVEIGSRFHSEYSQKP